MVVRQKFFSVSREVEFTMVTLSPDVGDSLLAEELMQQLSALIDEIGPVNLVVDFVDVDACPSAVIAALVAAQRKLQSLGGRMKLAIPSDRIQIVFQRLNLDLLFDIFPNREDAIHAWGEEAQS